VKEDYASLLPVHNYIHLLSPGTPNADYFIGISDARQKYENKNKKQNPEILISIL
jgi:hypothetical protein